MIEIKQQQQQKKSRSVLFTVARHLCHIFCIMYVHNIIGPFFVFHTVTTEQRISPGTFGHYQVNGKASIPALKQGRKGVLGGDEKRAHY